MKISLNLVGPYESMVLYLGSGEAEDLDFGSVKKEEIEKAEAEPW